MQDHKKIPGKRRRRCANCGCLRYDVETQVNPYLQDIQGETVIEPYCDDCVQILTDDI